ncbi:MAG: hypothetical protein ACI9H6_000657 [Patiriisocius sp.]|jgi:hypothetical protein
MKDTCLMAGVVVCLEERLRKEDLMDLAKKFGVPFIDDLPISGEEIKEFLIQVVGLYFDTRIDDATQFLRELLLVSTNEIRRVYSNVHDFEDAERAIAKLAQLEVLEIVVVFAMTKLEQLQDDEGLEYDERIALGLTDLLTLFIDLPEMVSSQIDEETLQLHQANDGG